MNLSKEARDAITNLIVELSEASDKSAEKAIKGGWDGRGRGSSYHNGKAVAYADAVIRLQKKLGLEKPTTEGGHLLHNWV